MCTTGECISRPDDEVCILECTFPRCEFVTINHLDGNHIFCVSCLCVIVHFNMFTPLYKGGKCQTCGTVHIEIIRGPRKGSLEWFKYDGNYRLIPASHGCLQIADPQPGAD